jgi:hypothetical protein
MSLKGLAVVALVAFPILAQGDCGWLLMKPPGTLSLLDPVNPVAPISQSYQSAAFDSAEACERWRRADIASARDAEMRGKGGRITTMQAGLSRCLPASQVPVR